ncbi:MAG: bifunctional DNA primase/polymerase, partial [Polyangiaceae bacterium]
MMAPTDTLEVALALHAAGIVAVPGSPQSKKPLVKWKRLQFLAGRPSEARLRALWGEHHDANPLLLAGETSGIVLLDADSADASAVLEAEFPGAPWSVRTRRWRHVAVAIPPGIEPRHLRN